MSSPESLFSRTTRGVKFDLARMRTMLAAAGEPHTCAPSILIAGTNGKGSVAAMWAAALQASGKRVGLYTSPHLVSVNERVVIDGQQCDLGPAMRVLDACERETQIELTFFEALTFLAFVTFKAAAVDVMVLEVGMGGRLDATNVVTPALSVITSIGLDHEEFLGTGERSIATEKAGILRIGVPAVVGLLSNEAMAGVHLPVHKLADHWSGDVVRFLGRERHKIEPALRGPHQRHNAALFVLGAFVYGLDDASIDAGLRAHWPGRYQSLSWQGIRVVVDGAHNPPAYRALAQTVREDAWRHPSVLVFGATSGRSHAEGLRELAPLFDHVVLCPPKSPRAIGNDDLLSVVPSASCETEIAGAFARAQTLGAQSVCVTGSLYLVGDALAFLLGAARQAVSDFR